MGKQIRKKTIAQIAPEKVGRIFIETRDSVSPCEANKAVRTTLGSSSCRS